MRPYVLVDENQQYLSPFLQSTLIGPIALQNWILSLLWALLIPVIKLVADRLIFSPSGKIILHDAIKKREEKNDKPQGGMLLLNRWRDSCWEFMVYGIFTVLGLAASVTEVWFFDTRHYWIGCSLIPCEQKLTSRLVLLYTVEMGFYIQAIPSLLFQKGPKKKDHYQMLVHHVVTLLLVAYSFSINLTRSGCMIFLLHDVCDVFLQLAKLIKYSQKETLATMGFIVFLFVWVGTRLYYFPRYVIRSCMYESMEFFVDKCDVHPSPHWEILNISLYTLFILHLYWTYLIIKVLHRTLASKGVTDDVREDEDDD